jgi:hypothetical protein
MGYHDLSECSLTEDERLAEAGRITNRLAGCQDELTNKEREFVMQMNDARFVSVKQLFYLRDISEKY